MIKEIEKVVNELSSINGGNLYSSQSRAIGSAIGMLNTIRAAMEQSKAKLQIVDIHQ
jgi:hypothetical protein